MTDVHLAEQGSGSVLLCLHGIGSASASFQPQLDELSDAHRVVAWDAPGYGKSADPTAAPGMSGYAAAVADVVDSLGEPVHLLGVSWGGVIGCRLALEHPELLRSLVLIGASRGSGRDAASAQAMRARVDELTRDGVETFALTRAKRLVSDEASPELVERATRIMTESIRLPGYAYAAQAMAETDLGPRLGEIRVPTLVICGDRDGVTGPAESAVLADGITDAVLVTVRGAGHQANQERPDAVNAWIASYLQIIERLYA